MNKLKTETRVCDRHGEYISTWYDAPRFWTMCHHCADERRVKEREAQKQAATAAARAAELERRLQHTNVPKRFRHLTLAGMTASHPGHERVLGALRGYSTEHPWRSGGGLFVIGDPGTGKTSMVSALCLDLARGPGARARIVAGRDLVRRLRATWNPDAEESEEDVIRDYQADDLLAIDEIGVGFNTDAERVHLYDVVNGRYEEQRPTIVISNLGTVEIRKVLGDRTYDRLRDGAQLLTCDWPSYRKPASESHE